MKKVLLLLSFIVLSVACTSVDSGHKGVKEEWGGKTDLTQVYPEGMHWGLNWMFDDMIQYEVKEKTMVHRFQFNDKNNMVTTVELALDYAYDANKLTYLHVGITDVETKIIKTLKSAGKEVVPQYSAIELNISKRVEAENKLSEIIKHELPEFYIEFKRVQMTDVDIPKAVAQLAEDTAVQLGKNELAKKKEAEEIANAKALVAKAEGEYEAAKFNEKTKALMSKPKYLELYKAETERIWAKKGVSPWGNNNVFGTLPSLYKTVK
jgi:hypothetical protein